MTSYHSKNSTGVSGLRVVHKYSYLVACRPVYNTADTDCRLCYM